MEEYDGKGYTDAMIVGEFLYDRLVKPITRMRKLGERPPNGEQPGNSELPEHIRQMACAKFDMLYGEYRSTDPKILGRLAMRTDEEFSELQESRELDERQKELLPMIRDFRDRIRGILHHREGLKSKGEKA